MNILGNLVKQYREKNGLSVREFAALTDLSNPQVMVIEEGESGNLTEQNYEKLAQVLEVPISTLTNTITNINNSKSWITDLVNNEAK